MTSAKTETGISPVPLNPLVGHDETVWVIHYHDGYASHETKVRAHCRHCAWRRFERQNHGCRISVVVPNV